MYKTFCMLFSLYALMRNVLQYTTWRAKNIKISKREETVQDMPPVPPVINPDWHTIWHPNTNKEEGNSLKTLTENLVRSLGIHNMTDRRRITLIVQAYMLYTKLLKEDSFVNFPSSLSTLDKQSDESKNHIVLLSKGTFHSLCTVVDRGTIYILIKRVSPFSGCLFCCPQRWRRCGWRFPKN